MPTTIRKALISEFGDISKINVVSAEIADPGLREVQVKVIYAGFSGSDINMRLGVYPLQKKAPFNPGYCLVGRVHANGQGSMKYQPGDVVACLSVYDAEAELANLPEKYLIPVPSELDLQQATALVLDWNTAYGMVIRSARVSAGQKVFVHGLSGAVGYAIMAISLFQGAQVYGTASERNHEALRKLGTTPFVYTNKDWISHIQEIGGVDAVFDPLGFESWDESYFILNSSGALLGYGGNQQSLNGGSHRSVVFPVLKLLARNMMFWTRRRTVFYYISRDDKNFVSDLRALFELLEQGEISVPIKAVYPLEDIKVAHGAWSKTAGMGSMLIKVADK